jgi:hypothetical protein
VEASGVSLPPIAGGPEAPRLVTEGSSAVAESLLAEGGSTASAEEPDAVPEVEEEDGGGYLVLESADGKVWKVIGSSEGENAEDARRAYFEQGDDGPTADENLQYVAVHRRSFKPKRPKVQPRRYSWSPA